MGRSCLRTKCPALYSSWLCRRSIDPPFFANAGACMDRVNGPFGEKIAIGLLCFSYQGNQNYRDTSPIRRIRVNAKGNMKPLQWFCTHRYRRRNTSCRTSLSSSPAISKFLIRRCLYTVQTMQGIVMVRFVSMRGFQKNR